MKKLVVGMILVISLISSSVITADDNREAKIHNNYNVAGDRDIRPGG